MRSRYWLATLLALSIAPSASAQNSDTMTLLTGEALSDAFGGKTHYGTYKEFRQKTGTNKFTEVMSADGRTDYKEGPQRLIGRWAVVNDDNMCFVYEDFPGTHCFIMFLSGTCIYGYNPELVRNGRPLYDNAWTVKSVRKGDVSTCDDLIG